MLYRYYWQPGKSLPNITLDSPDQLYTSSHWHTTDNSIVIDILQRFQSSMENQFTEVCIKLGNIHERIDTLKQRQSHWKMK